MAALVADPYDLRRVASEDNVELSAEGRCELLASSLLSAFGMVSLHQPHRANRVTTADPALSRTSWQRG
jgi:hypothetical protein